MKTQRTERASIQALPAPGVTTAAVAAAEQSERLDVPLLEAIVATDAVKTDLPLYVCAARADGKAPHLLDVVTGPCAVLVGPEGGLTDADLAAISAKPDAVAVTLGPSVLRAETAACVALAFAGGARGNLCCSVTDSDGAGATRRDRPADACRRSPVPRVDLVDHRTPRGREARPDGVFIDAGAAVEDVARVDGVFAVAR